MYELVRAGENTYYFECPAKVGLYVQNGADAYLIDSGNDKDAAKKLLRALGEHGWQLRGVVCTHSHADHIGGCRWLQAQTGCRVFAAGVEAAFTREPMLEPAFLYGGFPSRDLRHKFLMADGCKVTDPDDAAWPAALERIPLPGHSFGMEGVRTPDGVAFLADCLASPHTLQKYRIPFLYDVAAQLETLDRVEKMRAELFVPSHTDAVTDVRNLARLNRENTLAFGAWLLEQLRMPLGLDALLERVFTGFHLKMTLEQHALVGSAVRSYLAWLRDAGRAEAAIPNGTLLWRRTEE